MRMKSLGWVVGSLGMLLGAGSASADEEIKETTTVTPSGTSTTATEESTPDTEKECKDAGVTVSFTTGSSELNTNAKGALNGVATWMKIKDSRTIKLQGFTDKRGSVAANTVLSQRRAESVKQYLISQGVQPERIAATGLGEELVGSLPASGRTVTVVACAVPAPAPVAAAEPEPEPAAPEPEPEAAPPAPEPAPQVYAPVTVIPPPAPVQPVAVPVRRTDVPPSGFGIQATVGGGVVGFANNDVNDFADTGGEWEARMTFGSRSYVAFEAAYVGTAQGMNALGLQDSAVLLGNGAEGLLRVNFTTMRVQPYIFGGGGFTHYQVANSAVNTSAIRGSDNIGTVPTGVGLSGRVSKEFVLDVRGTYRFAFDDQLFDVALADVTSTPRLDTWNVLARLGFEF